MVNNSKINNKILIVFFLYLTFTISLVGCGIIIPDKTLPLLINKPSVNQKGQNLIITFQLSDDSIGLRYREFIGVSFTINEGIYDFFSDTYDFTNNIQKDRFTCNLNDVGTGSHILMSSQPSQKGSNLLPESNILYCRLDDINITLKPGNIYRLIIGLSSISFSNQFIRNVGLFTSTSNSAENVIIDSTPVFGSLGLYKNLALNTGLLKMEGIQILCPKFTSTDSKIYPYYTFDVVIQITVLDYISPLNSVFVIRYPTDTVQPPNMITSEDYVVKLTTIPKLTGNLQLAKFSDDSLQIVGISEDLFTDRQFQLTFKNWKALDANIDNTKNFEIWVYYRNTYSVQSYLYKDIFTISKANAVMTSINHPENFDIYSNAAWPMTFKFKTNADLENGGFVVIQQYDTIELNSKWVFSASTCDFTQNDPTIVNLQLGKRPVCAPIQNSLKFPNSSLVDYYDGSGIFFKMDKILSTSTYTLNVWGFAENCGNSSDPTDAIRSSKKFMFKMTIYRTFDPKNEGVKRFTKAAGNTILAQSVATSISNTCYYTTSTIDYSLSKATSTTTGDRLFYKEFNSFSLINTNNSYKCNDPSSCYSADIRTSSARMFNEVFLNSNIPQNNYFMLRATFPLSRNQILRDKFPMGVSDPNIPQPGRIQVKFSKDYVGVGDPISDSGSNECVLSWGFLVDNDNYSEDYAVTRSTYTTSSTANFISGNGAIDQTKSNLPLSNTSSTIQITSKFDAGGSSFDSTLEGNKSCYIKNAIGASTFCNAVFVLYTNCLTIKRPTTPVKSIYAYFDVIYTFQFMAKETNPPVPNRVARFVKFYPEYSVFNDVSTSTARDNFITYHYSFGNSELDNAVCILEINGSKLQQFINDNNTLNTLQIFLFNLNLLDIDYSLTANLYPFITKNTSSLSTYSFNNSTPFTSNNPINYLLLYSPSYYTTLYDNTTSNNLYLASSLIIQKAPDFVTAFNLQATDILVPTMCPYLRENSSHVTNPIVTVQMYNLDINSEISLNVKIYKYSTNNMLHKMITSKSNQTTYFQKNATLRFNRYSSSSSENQLNIFNGTLNDNGTFVNCSGFAAFFNSNISVNNNIQFKYFDTTILPYYSSLSYRIYVHGKEFSHLAIGVLSSTIAIEPSYGMDSYEEQSDFKLMGINRPAVEFFYDSSVNQFKKNDYIGLYCHSSSIKDSAYLTNFIYDVSRTSNVSNYIIDFNSDDTNISSITFIKDNNSVFYKNDLGANFRATISLNSVTPIGSYLKFTSTQNFNLNTLCGINYSINNNAVACSSSTYYDFTCPILEKNDKYIICCHNIGLTSNFSLDNLSINMDHENNNNMENYLNTQIYKANPNFLNWFIDYTTLPSIDTLDSATIQSITYSYVNQENGIGKVILKIVLPRELPRNAKITISGDFFNIAIPDVIPFCTVSTSSDFNLNYDNGDSIIKSCSASNILSRTNSIQIITKNEIYKCGLSFSKTIYLRLWPIINYNFNKEINNSYTINIFGNSSGEKFAKNNFSQILPQIDYLTDEKLTKPLLTGLWDNLGNIIRIFPRLVEETSFYDFEFDISSNRYIFSDIMPNEFTIFFPLNLYQISLANLECLYFNNIYGKINCYSDSDGVYTIRFANSISLTDPNPIIRIMGIINPGFDIKYLRIPCTVNYVNEQHQRFNLLTGATLLVSGIANPSLTRNIGNLILQADKYVLSDVNPRSFGIITFKVSFDKAMNTIPSSIASPILIITFPNEFNFGVFKQVSITAQITEWIWNDSKQIQTGSVFSTTSMFTFKNSIVLNFDFNKSFDKFGYWVIVLRNIPAPFDTTMTSSIKVCLTNKIFSVLFKSFTNLNSLETTPLSQRYDELLTSHQGLYYDYDLHKFIIDIVPNDDGEKNVIILSPGIFVEYNFVLRTDILLLPTSSTEISLLDDNFKLGENSYTLLSSSGKKSFLIGTPCSSFKGTFYITFNLSNTKNFTLIPPIKVIVKDITVNNINVTYDDSVPQGAFSLISYELDKMSFDQLSMTWESDPKNDSSASIYSIVILPKIIKTHTTFQIFNADQIADQKFSIKNPNKCFNINIKQITIELGETVFPDLGTLQNSNIISKFAYASESETNLPKNSIRITFDPPFTPIDLFCVIQCKYSDFPSNDEIINSTDNSGYTYKTYIFKSDLINIEFNNLLRGQTYKVRCILKTTNSNYDNAEYSVDLDSITYNDTNKLTLSSPQITTCLNYIFKRDPGQTIRRKLLNYCQTKFNFKGGCITCMDNYGQTLPGLKIQSYFGCNLNKDEKSLYDQIIDNNNPFGYPTQQRNMVYYTVCAVPDLKCQDDVIDKSYKNFIYTMMKDLNSPLGFSYTLKIPVPPLDYVNIYSDDLQPDLVQIKVKNIITNANGFYSVTLTNSIPLVCFWMISPSSILSYSFDNIMQCDDLARCGKVKVNNQENKFIADNDDLKIFLPGNYNIWLACFNDIPNPQKRSNPYVVNVFKISPMSFTLVSSARFIYLSYWTYLLFVWFILFTIK